jgi:hypothetical protein
MTLYRKSLSGEDETWLGFFCSDVATRQIPKPGSLLKRATGLSSSKCMDPRDLLSPLTEVFLK